MLIGDFHPLLPVKLKGNHADIVSATIKTSELWNHVTTLKLTQNMRVQKIIAQNPTPLNQFADWLLKVGEGTAPTVTQNVIAIPNQMVSQTPKILRDAVYDNFLHNHTDTEYLQNRAIMACTNKTVQQENFNMIA